MMSFDNYYYLGTITKKHGLKGDVIIRIDTDDPELYENLESLFLDFSGNLIPFFISHIQLMKYDTLRVRFEENQFPIEELIGKETYLPLNSLPALTGKKFYYHEIKNFKLLDDGKECGTITEVNDATPQHLFVVNHDHKNYYIPIIEDWINEINRDEKYISMSLPNGLFEL